MVVMLVVICGGVGGGAGAGGGDDGDGGSGGGDGGDCGDDDGEVDRRCSVAKITEGIKDRLGDRIQVSSPFQTFPDPPSLDQKTLPSSLLSVLLSITVSCSRRENQS